MIDLSVSFHLHPVFFWWLAWCATLCFVNGFRPRVAANDMVVIVCQCDNVWFPISMWSWTFDEGGILSGRQSAVICHQLNELLSRHPLGFQWQYYIHRSFGLMLWFSHTGNTAHCIKGQETWSPSCLLPHVATLEKKQIKIVFLCETSLILVKTWSQKLWNRDTDQTNKEIKVSYHSGCVLCWHMKTVNWIEMA